MNRIRTHIRAICIIALALALVFAYTNVFPSPAHASVVIGHCDFGTHTSTGKCRGYLTASPGSLLTWTVPADWNNSNNTIEAIGGGGGGAWGDVNWSGPGGGAGA